MEKNEQQEEEKEDINDDTNTQNKQQESEDLDNDSLNSQNSNDDDGADEQNASQENGATMQEFNLELLPKPEIVFTQQSLVNYNPGFNNLELADIVEDARQLETTTSVEQAIQAINSLEEYANFNLDSQIFQDGPDEAAGVGEMYEVQFKGKTMYVSFIRRSSRWARKNKKNGLRSSMVFILWNEKPIS